MNHRTRVNNAIWKRNESQFLLISIMLALFCVLKVLRGGNTASDNAGGLWNYISLLYYPVFLFVVASRHVFRIRKVFINAVMFLCAIFVGVMVNLEIQLNVSYMYQMLMVPYAMLVFFTFYLCSTGGAVGMRIIYWGYLGCLALNLFFSYSFRFASGDEAMRSDIYYSLGLFPFALQVEKKRTTSLALFVLQFLAVFMSNKRVAFVGFVLGTVLYLLIQSWISDRRKFGKMIKTVILVAVVGFVLYRATMYIDSVFGFNIYSRLFNLADDEGSGRLDIYHRVWRHFGSSDVIEKLFGHGIGSVGKIAGAGHAHNDLLEVLYNYGVFASLLLGLFYLSVICEGIHLVKRKSPYAAAFAFSVLCGLLLAMFSYFMVYYTYVTCFVAFWGYALAMERRHAYGDRGELA